MRYVIPHHLYKLKTSRKTELYIIAETHTYKIYIKHIGTVVCGWGKERHRICIWSTYLYLLYTHDLYEDIIHVDIYIYLWMSVCVLQTQMMIRCLRVASVNDSLTSWYIVGKQRFWMNSFISNFPDVLNMTCQTEQSPFFPTVPLPLLPVLSLPLWSLKAAGKNCLEKEE